MLTHPTRTLEDDEAPISDVDLRWAQDIVNLVCEMHAGQVTHYLRPGEAMTIVKPDNRVADRVARVLATYLDERLKVIAPGGVSAHA